MDQDAFIKELTKSVTLEVSDNINEIVADALKQHVNKAMQKIFTQSEFYRRVSDNMLDGLQTIYKEINQATQNEKKSIKDVAEKHDTKKLFFEATKQLDSIMATTLEATEKIMETTELLFESQKETEDLLLELKTKDSMNPKIQRLIELNEQNNQAYTTILETLSFQDLTGQRLKKVVDALGKISTIVFELYISTGLMLKNDVDNQEKNFDTLAKESKKTANDIIKGKSSELKGPSSDAQSQNNVDDLLSSLGL